MRHRRRSIASRVRKICGRASMSSSARHSRSLRIHLARRIANSKSKTTCSKINSKSLRVKRLKLYSTLAKRSNTCRLSWPIWIPVLIKPFSMARCKQKTLQNSRPSSRRQSASYRTFRAITIATRLYGRAKFCSSRLKRTTTSVTYLNLSVSLS